MAIALGIETSCDETGVALFCESRGLLAEALLSQTNHAQYGGIVPEAASREHVRQLPLLLKTCFQRAGIESAQLDIVAYTAGPGLLGALMVGAFFARTLASEWRLPAIGVHHMEGHLLAALIDNPETQPPFLALLVSGGHTQLVDVASIGAYTVLGETVDDAVGEVFDKVAIMLGLGYPGGAKVATLAERGDATKYHFTRPMLRKAGLDFSFSGLKTQVRYLIRDLGGVEALDAQKRADIAAAFEQAAVESLVQKTIRALHKTRRKCLIIAGGVSANTLLRKQLQRTTAALAVSLQYPKPALCTDNGVMIAYAGLVRYRLGQRDAATIAIKPRWPMSAINV